MSRKTDTSVVARTIGIDTGKNTLHLIGLDDKGAIVLREKLSWLSVPTYCRPVSSGLSRISVAIGGAAMSVLNTSLRRSKSWHTVPRAAGS